MGAGSAPHTCPCCPVGKRTPLLLMAVNEATSAMFITREDVGAAVLHLNQLVAFALIPAARSSGDARG